MPVLTTKQTREFGLSGVIATLVGLIGAGVCLAAGPGVVPAILTSFAAAVFGGIVVGRTCRSPGLIALLGVAAGFSFAVAIVVPECVAAGEWVAVLLSSGVWCAGPAYAFTVAVSASLVVWSREVEYRSRRTHDRCVSCDYDLRGSPGEACPECGEPFVRAPMSEELARRQFAPQSSEAGACVRRPLAADDGRQDRVE